VLTFIQTLTLTSSRNDFICKW